MHHSVRARRRLRQRGQIRTKKQRDYRARERRVREIVNVPGALFAGIRIHAETSVSRGEFLRHLLQSHVIFLAIAQQRNAIEMNYASRNGKLRRSHFPRGRLHHVPAKIFVLREEDNHLSTTRILVGRSGMKRMRLSGRSHSLHQFERHHLARNLRETLQARLQFQESVFHRSPRRPCCTSPAQTRTAAVE